jgi:glutathionyl-hydroquinone reductase
MDHSQLQSLQVYVVHFKCNKELIREYRNVRDYVKEIYQMPAINVDLTANCVATMKCA